MSATAANQKLQQAAEYIQANSGRTLPLEALSRRAGMSPFHFQRSFKSMFGLTPRQYQEACRVRAFKEELRQGDNVLDAIFAAGFGSASRLYERVDSRLGMKPSEYRAGGAHVAITYATIATPLGLLTIAATDRGVCFVALGDSEDELIARLRHEFPRAQLAGIAKPQPAPFRAWVRAIQEHLQGARPRLDLPLDIRATAFQARVWRYLQSIPYGDVRSYGEVAQGIGQPNAARAVASACARNPVPLLIPCHRVIRGTGEPGRY